MFVIWRLRQQRDMSLLSIKMSLSCYSRHITDIYLLALLKVTLESALPVTFFKPCHLH